LLQWRLFANNMFRWFSARRMDPMSFTKIGCLHPKNGRSSTLRGFLGIHWRARLLADCLQVLLLVQCANNGSCESGESVASIQRMYVARLSFAFVDPIVAFAGGASVSIFLVIRPLRFILSAKRANDSSLARIGCLHPKNDVRSSTRAVRWKHWRVGRLADCLSFASH